MTTPTATKGLTKIATGELSGAWGPVLDTNFDIIDAALGGTTSLTLTNTNVVLTTTQAQSLIYKLSGALTGNVVVYFPTGAAGIYVIQNNTQSSTFKVIIWCAAGGTQVTVPQGYRTTVICDGTNIALADDRTSWGFTGSASSWCQRFPSGFTIQGGQVAGGLGDSSPTFLVPFTSVFSVTAKIYGRPTTTVSIFDVNVDNLCTTGFSAGPRYITSGAVAVATQTYYWTAYGFITPP